MEKRHMASFAVTPNLIEQALTMPEGHEIVGAEWDFASRTVRLFVEGPSLPEVERGQIVPSIVPSVTVAVCDDGKRVHSWNWNASNPAFEPTAARPGPSVGSKGNVGLREMDT